MLTIIATLPEDGWAYVREGSAYYLVRPPFDETKLVDERVVATAVTRHDFIASCVDCHDWHAIYEHLQAAMRAQRVARGEDAQPLGEAMLKVAPRTWLVTLINRVERQHLPQKKYAVAEAMLRVLRDVPRVRDDEELRVRVAGLQQRLGEVQSPRERVMSNGLNPRVGMLARVRNRHAIIANVQSFDGPPQEHLVTVEYLDTDGPAEDQLLWARERKTHLFEPSELPEPYRRGPMVPAEFDALVRATRWTALTPFVDPDGDGPLGRLPLAAPFHGAIQVEDFQLVPLLKALQMPRVTMLIADDVGLGKTVEAGLILSELLLRRRIRRVLILCPAALRTQWKQELHEKFSLPFEEVDRAKTHALRKDLGLDASPWRTYNRIIASYHYLRQPDVLEAFRAACATTPGSARLPWDLLIVDEAHHLAPAPFGEDSDLSRMLGVIAPLFEHKIFLSATPHNGHTRSFTGLLEYLDPVRFTRSAKLSPSERDRLDAVLVRRLKREINAATSPPRFCDRLLQGIPLALSPHERELSTAFQGFRTRVRSLVAHKHAGEQRAGAFAVEILGKRLLSGALTFADSWHRYLDGLREASDASAAEVFAAKREADDETADDRENNSRIAHASRTVGAWMKPLADDLRGEIDAIDRNLAALSLGPDVPRSPSRDARFEALCAWIDQHLRTPGKAWRDDERLVVFTEYKTTLDAIVDRLTARHPEPGAVRALYGGLPDDERDAVRASFNDPGDPVRVLVATDAASEGLNLQETARYLLHYDVPWNPSRLEQRNGRLDRHGQARDVTVHHFETDDDADLRFIAGVVRKVHAIREDLGSAGEVFDAAFERRLLLGEPTGDVLGELDDALRVNGMEAIPRADPSTATSHGEREIAQLDALAREIDLDPDTLRSTLDVALGLGHAHAGPHFEGTAVKGCFRLRHIAPRWEPTLDASLRITDRERRKALPAVTFDPLCFLSGRGDERKVFRPLKDTALLHLGHPIFLRALSTFARLRFPGAEDTASRWTVRRGDVPAGADALVLLYLEELAVNELRETFHHWVRPLRLPLRDGNLGASLPHRPARPRRVDAPDGTPTPDEARRASELWLEVERDVKELTREHARHLDTLLRSTLAAEHEHARGGERERFRSRQGELSKLIEQQTLTSIRSEIAERELALRQLSLFGGDNDRRRRELDELRREAGEELSRRARHYDDLRTLLDKERTRVLERVLPMRYALRGSAQAFPLAVEIVLPQAQAS